jgi:hypothetical protein
VRRPADLAGGAGPGKETGEAGGKNNLVAEILTHLISSAVRGSNDVLRISGREPALRGEKVAVRIRKKDRFAFQLYTFFRRNLLIRLLLAALVLLGLLVLTADAGTALAFFGIALFVALWGVGLALFAGAKRADETQQVCAFAAEGFYFMHKGEIRRIPWRRLLLRKTPGHYFLYYSPFAAFIFPNRELNAAALETVRHYAAEYQLRRRPRGNRPAQ